MKLTFIGAAHEVTGSCTLFEACGKHILIDCGMEQGADTYENCNLPINPTDIDAICLTHAHIDHSGMIPAMVAKGYTGPIYSTVATHKLCSIMLQDSAHIQEQEAEWKNRKAERNGSPRYEPIYTVTDALKTLKQFNPIGYKKKIDIFDGISIEFIDAGHLLGSSSIYISAKEGTETKTVLFSGDLGNVQRPLIRDPQKPEYADYVVVESTYGDRIHGERPDYILQLVDILNETFSKGGNLVIPSFAIGRTQELLYLFRHIKENRLLDSYQNFPVYVDSPLAAEATKIYQDNLFDYYDDEALQLLKKGIDPINFQNLYLSITKEESIAINVNKMPKVIISASGMCEAGRIKHHLKHNLWNENNTVLFVGYQSEGTLGRKLVNGAKSVNLFGEEIQVKAKIASIAGISGHADRDMIIDWLKALRQTPKKVFVNHGDDIVCDGFAQTIYNKIQFPAVAPYSGDEYDLISGECVRKSQIIKITKISDGRRRANLIFEKLLSACDRLKTIANLCKALPNKELAKFVNQINDLCDKYSKKINKK